jgi:uncharacterized protein
MGGRTHRKILKVAMMEYLKALDKKQKTIGISVGVLLLFGIAFDRWLPYSLLSHHKYTVEAHPAILDRYRANAETFTFTTGDRVDISGWFIPAKSPSKQTLVILHTRGGTRQDTLEFGLPLWQAGFNLAVIDLRGHGNSGGKYFTFGYHEWQDVSGLIDYLEARQDGSATDVTLIGISAGGAVAVSAAARDPRIKRLVTIASFADLGETIQQQVPWLPEFWRIRAIQEAEHIGQFEVKATSPIHEIQKVKCPVLIVHGAEDRYIPLENGKKLFESATSRKEFYAIAGASHENMLQPGGPELKKRITDFAAQRF